MVVDISLFTRLRGPRHLAQTLAAPQVA